MGMKKTMNKRAQEENLITLLILMMFIVFLMFVYIVLVLIISGNDYVRDIFSFNSEDKEEVFSSNINLLNFLELEIEFNGEEQSIEEGILSSLNNNEEQNKELYRIIGEKTNLICKSEKRNRVIMLTPKGVLSEEGLKETYTSALLMEGSDEFMKEYFPVEKYVVNYNNEKVEIKFRMLREC